MKLIHQIFIQDEINIHSDAATYKSTAVIEKKIKSIVKDIQL